ncbi:hypothetical protein QFZ94_000310 [Paraburkholderia sp. JPY465]
MNEHQNGEGYKVDSSECLRQALVISRESTKAVQPAEATFHHPATGQQHKALFRFRQLDHLKLDSFIQRCLRGLLAGIALIGKRYLDRLACGLLDRTRKPADLGTLLLVGRRNMHCKQLRQCIYLHVDLAAALAFIAVVTGARSTVAGRLQRAPIEKDCVGLHLPALHDPDNRARIAHHSLDTTRLNPAQRSERLAQFAFARETLMYSLPCNVTNTSSRCHVVPGLRRVASTRCAKRPWCCDFSFLMARSYSTVAITWSYCRIWCTAGAAGI